ncbi:MAG: hypothetical protein GX654_19200 [Desulfatiglans sp.]|nr:hypothetical protein [Desulfatiglans sp.]
MKKIILLSLYLIFINSACIAADNENQYITNIDEVDKTIEIFFNSMQSGDVKKSYEMLTDNYKKLFEKKYGMNYLEAYGDEAYQAETHAHRFVVLEKKLENNAIYITAEYYLKSSDSPDEDEKKVFIIKIIKLKNKFMIDDIIYQE